MVAVVVVADVVVLKRTRSAEYFRLKVAVVDDADAAVAAVVVDGGCGVGDDAVRTMGRPRLRTKVAGDEVASGEAVLVVVVVVVGRYFCTLSDGRRAATVGRKTVRVCGWGRKYGFSVRGGWVYALSIYLSVCVFVGRGVETIWMRFFGVCVCGCMRISEDMDGRLCEKLRMQFMSTGECFEWL